MEARINTAFFQKDTEAAQWVEALYAKGYTKVQTRLVGDGAF